MSGPWHLNFKCFSYAEDAQEALDLILQAYAVAEHPQVLTSVMVNLDGFVLTHTYELVDVPLQEDANAFLPSFSTDNKMDFAAPKSLGFNAGPAFYMEFKRKFLKQGIRISR